MDKLVLDQSILDCLYDGLYVLDRERRITFWNQSAERLTGYSQEEVLGRPCSDDLLMHLGERGEQLCLERCPMALAMADGQVHEAEVFLHHKEGHRVPVRLRAAPLRDAGGNIVGAVEVFGDRSPHLAAQQRIQELERMSLLDELTRLPNRRYLLEQIKSRLHELRRADWPFGLLYMDLDQWEAGQERRSRPRSEALLQLVSRTVAHNTRAFDVVGRWGGGEFLAVVPNVDLDKLGKVAERYRALVAESALPGPGPEEAVTISVGATMAREEDTVQSLIVRAGQSLFLSKEVGGDRVTVR
ncbi:MAG: diguanylate cyclase [Desulfarculus sp.]|nr:MAG: diguanylate cyclase [Desulfarculus sp.]